MKKYFVVADVHGFYTILQKALNKAGFDINNPDHVLVSCGDLTDRGNEPRECLQFVLSLPPERRILVRGNHEDLMEEAIHKGYFDDYDYSNGTAGTAALLTGEKLYEDNSEECITDAMKHNELWNQYMSQTVDYAEIGNYIIVHGWIPCKDTGYSFIHTVDYDKAASGQWYKARWINGMEAEHDGIYVPGKIIICGHYHCSFGHAMYETHEYDRYAMFDERADWTPYITEHMVALDACTVISHKINVFTFNA